MAKEDYRQEGADLQSGNHQGLDRELDAALARYTCIEPRVGLEQRILANLRAERQPVLNPGFWHRSVWAGLAVVLIVAWALPWKSGRSQPDYIMQPPPTAAQRRNPGKQFVSTNEGSGARSRGPTRARRPAERRVRPPVIVTAQPKLDQFPSPQPLSQQERILASYVARYPEHAALVAAAMTKALRQDSEEEAQAAAPGSAR